MIIKGRPPTKKMKTNQEIDDQVMKDLATLRIDLDKVESLTVENAKAAYRKEARVIHPDKADPTNAEQVKEFTSAFQELSNCYQRVLQYIIEKLQSQSNENTEVMNDEAKFAKENFGKFNFPYENKGSFTVNVEDSLAKAWEDCLEHVYGDPKINPNGDRMWKTMFGEKEQQIEITVHFYNHDKPKDKKQSKILIQGSVQSSICEYVFCELPKVYKMVSLQKVPTIPMLRQSKRKRLTTPVKKGNIKYKAATKAEGQDCTYCNFTAYSRIKIKQHMKTNHTETVQETSANPIVLAEDMSVCEVSDDEELLIEEKICDQCDFVAEGEDLLKRHHDNCHTKTIVSTLEENVPTPPAVKPIPLYKCNSCTFATTTTDELKDHKTIEHVIEIPMVKVGPEENKYKIQKNHSCSISV